MYLKRSTTDWLGETGWDVDQYREDTIGDKFGVTVIKMNSVWQVQIWTELFAFYFVQNLSLLSRAMGKL